MALQSGDTTELFCFHVRHMLFCFRFFFFFFSPLKNLSHSWFASITKTGWGLDLTWYSLLIHNLDDFMSPVFATHFINSENL